MPYFPPKGGGSGGSVDSVNGKTGNVVLTYNDVAPSRSTVSRSGATGNVNLTVSSDSFHLVSMTASAATRVRGYRSISDRTADESRLAGTVPASQGVVLFEFVFDEAGTYWTTGFKTFLTEDSTTLYLRVDGTANLDLVLEA